MGENLHGYIKTNKIKSKMITPNLLRLDVALHSDKLEHKTLQVAIVRLTLIYK